MPMQHWLISKLRHVPAFEGLVTYLQRTRTNRWNWKMNNLNIFGGRTAIEQWQSISENYFHIDFSTTSTNKSARDIRGRVWRGEIIFKLAFIDLDPWPGQRETEFYEFPKIVKKLTRLIAFRSYSIMVRNEMLKIFISSPVSLRNLNYELPPLNISTTIIVEIRNSSFIHLRICAARMRSSDKIVSFIHSNGGIEQRVPSSYTTK